MEIHDKKRRRKSFSRRDNQRSFHYSVASATILLRSQAIFLPKISLSPRLHATTLVSAVSSRYIVAWINHNLTEPIASFSKIWKRSDGRATRDLKYRSFDKPTGTHRQFLTPTGFNFHFRYTPQPRIKLQLYCKTDEPLAS